MRKRKKSFYMRESALIKDIQRSKLKNKPEPIE